MAEVMMGINFWHIKYHLIILRRTHISTVNQHISDNLWSIILTQILIHKTHS